jgi:hypothetical protein
MILVRKFGASWCKSCVTLDQQLHDYFSLLEKDPEITVEFIDIDEDTSYDHITKLPTIQVYNKLGECVHTLEGLASCSTIKTLVIPNIQIDTSEDF